MIQQAVRIGLGEQAVRSGFSCMAAPTTTTELARTRGANVRSHPSSRSASGRFVVLGVRGRTSRDEVFARRIRLIAGEHPSRALCLGRTCERLAEIRANELTADAEFGRKRLRANELIVQACHVLSLPSFVRGHWCKTITRERSNCKDIVNVRHVHIRTNDHPPYHPPREESTACLVAPGAKRAGRSFFCRERSRVRGGNVNEVPPDEGSTTGPSEPPIEEDEG